MILNVIEKETDMENKILRPLVVFDLETTGLVKEKDYLDNILKDVDPNISLDKNQREVILNNESPTWAIKIKKNAPINTISNIILHTSAKNFNILFWPK